MNPVIIRKAAAPPDAPPPVFADPARARAEFSWAAFADTMGAPLDGPLNLGDLAVSRGGAIVWHGSEGQEHRYDADALRASSGRVANALRELDLHAGDRVVLMLRAVPELFFAVLGCLRAGLVPCVLGRVRNPAAVRHVLSRTGAKLAVMEADARPLVAGARGELPALRHVVVVRGAALSGELAWAERVDRAPEAFDAPALPADAPASIHYTDLGMSGVVSPHRSAFALAASAGAALDLRAGDHALTLSVPGDTLFLPYQVLAPLLVGATTHAFEDPARYNRYAAFPHPVSVWYSQVRALDVVLRADPGLGTLLAKCRHIAVAWPYEPAFVEMTEYSYGSPLHPTWMPRELGAIQTAALRAEDIVVGSVGRPLPGVEARVDDDKLAVRIGPGSPFGGYWNDPEMTGRRVKDGWFVSDAPGRIDDDGTAWIVP